MIRPVMKSWRYLLLFATIALAQCSVSRTSTIGYTTVKRPSNFHVVETTTQIKLGGGAIGLGEVVDSRDIPSLEDFPPFDMAMIDVPVSRLHAESFLGSDYGLSIGEKFLPGVFRHQYNSPSLFGAARTRSISTTTISFPVWLLILVASTPLFFNIIRDFLTRREKRNIGFAIIPRA